MGAATKHTLFAAVSVLLVGVVVAGSTAAGAPRRDRVAPSPPANVHVTAATPSLVHVAWDAAQDDTGVAGYYVYGDSGRAAVWSPAYVVTSLGCGESSIVSIVAYDRSGNRSSRESAAVSTAACPDVRPPSAPKDFNQAATTQDSVVLRWTASSDDVGVVGYAVYAGVVRVASTAEPTATLTGLSCGSTYRYDVDATDAAGNRSPLAAAFIRTAACSDITPPSVPSALAVTGRTASSVSLGWAPSTDDLGVVEYRVTLDGAPALNVSQPSATLSGLQCGRSYMAEVDALDAAGNRSPATRLGVATAACASSTPPGADTAPPTAPNGLSASSISQTQLTLGWNAATDNVGVTAYDVYRAGTKVATVASTSSAQTGLVCGTTYAFGVVSRDAAGNASQPAQLSVATSACSSPPPPADTSAPTDPSSLRLSSVTRTSASLAWNAATDNVGVTGYRTYVNGSPGATTSVLSATVASLNCGTAYTFEVDASDAAGNRSPKASLIGSTAACADGQAPTVPTNVVATSRTATSIALSWSPSSDNLGVAGYGLHRGGAQVATSTEPAGIFSGLSCGSSYTLGIDAYDAAGNRSAKANVMVSTTACPDTAPPSAPGNLAASGVTQTGLTLAWAAANDNVGVTGYDVYRNGTRMQTVTSTSTAQSGLGCATQYTFAVVARDAAGNSSAQAQITVTTSACPPRLRRRLPPPTSGQVLFDGGFDTGSTSQWTYVHRYATDRFTVVGSDSGVAPRKGSHMARVETRSNEPTTWDSSMNISMAQREAVAGASRVGDDVYTGFSLYLPSGFAYVPNQLANNIVEWHGNSSTLQAPVHFTINGYTGQFVLDLHTQSGWNPTYFTFGAVTTGRWVDFVFHTKWAKDGTGLIEGWMDGVKKFSSARQTWYSSGIDAVYPMAGYYRANYQQTATLYLDAFKVGTSYESVAP